MATIKQDDFIRSVADALQYISFYHPVDYITNLARAYELEQSPAAKDPMAHILHNTPRTPCPSASVTPAIAPEALAPSARTPGSAPASSRWAWRSNGNRVSPA